MGLPLPVRPVVLPESFEGGRVRKPMRGHPMQHNRAQCRRCGHVARLRCGAARRKSEDSPSSGRPTLAPPTQGNNADLTEGNV